MTESEWAAGIRRFCASWFSAPLGPEDGCSQAEIAEVEGDLGEELPGIVREWFSLLGKRLQGCQDYPVRLDQLLAVSRRLRARNDVSVRFREKPIVPLWLENQGVWTISAPTRSGDDPEITVSPQDFGERTARTSEALRGMLVSDTLVGAWAGRGRGPLGTLKEQVVGGCVDWREDLEAKFLRLPELPWFPNPFFNERYRGDDSLVARYNGDTWEWAARSSKAIEKAKQLFELDLPGGVQLVTLSMTNLRVGERDALPIGADRLRAAMGDAGRVNSTATSTTGDWFESEISTDRPDDCLRRILALLPVDVHGRLIVAVRPAGVSVHRVLYPVSHGARRWFPHG